MKQNIQRNIVLLLLVVLMLVLTSCDGFVISFQPIQSTQSKTAEDLTAKKEETEKAPSLESEDDKPSYRPDATTSPEDPDLPASPNDTAEKTTEASNQTEENLPDVPALDLNGQEFTILSTAGFEREMGFQPDQADVISLQTFSRNLVVEECLNVVISWTTVEQNSFTQLVQATTNVQDGSFHATSAAPRFQATLSVQGLYEDLNDDSIHLDLSGDDWNQSFVETATLNGHIFQAVGKYNYSVLERTPVVFFNSNLLDEYCFEDPYELLNNGSWTIEKLNTMVKMSYIDMDANGIASADDHLGLIAHDSTIGTASLGGMNLVLTEQQSNGSHCLIQGSDLTRVNEGYRKIKQLITANGYVSYQDSNALMEKFTEHGSLFMVNYFNSAADLNRSDVSFGILPFPKFDESQTDYVFRSAKSHSTMAIVVRVADDPMGICAVLELLNQSSQKVYQETFFRYTQTPNAYQVAEMIWSHLTWDFSVLLSDTSADPETLLWIGAIRQSDEFNMLYHEKSAKINEAYRLLFEHYQNIPDLR